MHILAYSMYICEIHTLFMNIIASTVRHWHTSRPFFRIYPPVILAVRRRRTSHFCIFLSLFVTFGGFLRLFPCLSPSKIPICYIRTKRHRYEPSTLRFCCFCQIADCRAVCRHLSAIPSPGVVLHATNLKCIGLPGAILPKFQGGPQGRKWNRLAL